jgi:hypothetical protein
MANGYTRSPRLSKGAFIKLTEGFLEPEQERIEFQYNPETMTRDLTSSSTETGGRAGKEATDEPYDPDESFGLTLELDAADDLEDADNHPETVQFGLAPRLAAIEALLYPQEINQFGDSQPSGIESADIVQRGSVSIVLFEWGQGRIVPVRVTSFKIEEQLFSPTLYPMQAKVTVALQVITGISLIVPDRKLTESEKLALSAYKVYRRTKTNPGSG